MQEAGREAQGGTGVSDAPRAVASPGPARSDVTVEVIDEPEGLPALYPVWDHLLEASPFASPYQSQAWVETWWRHFGRPRMLEAAVSCRPHVVVVKIGGEPAAIAPWLSSRVGGRSGVRLLVGIGQETADYGGAILGAHPEVVVPVLLDQIEYELGRGRTLIDFTRLREHGPLSNGLRERFGDDPRYALTRDIEEPYPYLALPTDGTAQSLVNKLMKRNDVRRRLRRLGEAHEVEFHYHRPGEVRADFATFMDLHRKRWTTRPGRATGLFAERAGQRFLADVAEALDLAGMLRLSVVTADGRPVAARFGTQFASCYQGMKSGWDPSFASYGPGHIAVALILQELQREGVAEFDFLRGAALHKLIWANGERPVSYQILGRSDRWSPIDRRWLWAMLRLRNRVRR
jgi:CelD/BcsL family acetyltransferase involved in cellulose biosynthesis